MRVPNLAHVQLADSRRGFCRRDDLFGAGIVVLSLALIWAARMLVAVHAPPPMLEFISADELER
jgi:hypothetical protein